MNYQITCPYCFQTFWDHQVLFRSERTEKGENRTLPEPFLDIEDFMTRYTGSDKEAIALKYWEYEFFHEQDDPVYQSFWENFGGTTEDDPADRALGVRAYRRPILNPWDPDHQRFLVSQGQDYLIRDRDGMAIQVKLQGGDVCSRRVCPHCHNPLPDNYGKSKVKFAAIIGITGAGKTIYLSQLLAGMTNYAAKAGLAAMVANPSARGFVEKNRVAPQVPLPGSTPATQFQQPLFYDLVRNTPQEGHVTETVVLYDVAGEVFKSPNLVQRFAPFIEHADGVIMLIDPMQFWAISQATKDGAALDEPTTVLQTIHNIITHGVTTEKCPTPFAVCLSKCDLPAVQEVLGWDLGSLLRSEVHGVKNGRLFLPRFNATEYNPIGQGLDSFILDQEPALAQQMETNYANYNFFAFTALNCEVGDYTDPSGFPFSAPVGPVQPMRVEEPLLWLFHQLGYIPSDVPVFRELKCPACGSIYVEELPPDQREVVTPGGFLKRRKTEYVDHICQDCGQRWLLDRPE